MARVKIAGEQLATIETALMVTLKAHGLHPFMVQNQKHAWQVFHKACDEGRIDRMALYRDCTDDHIDTALRTIFKHNARNR